MPHTPPPPRRAARALLFPSPPSATHSRRRTAPRARLAGLATVLACAGGGPMPAGAIELTWDGASGAPEWNALGFIRGEDGKRKLASNWSGVSVPANGDSLVFAGTNTLVNANTDAALTTIAGLDFAENAGAFTMGGTDLNLTGNLGNRSSARQTINFGLAVGGPNRVWDGGTGGIAINGAVNLRGNNLTLARNIAVDNTGVDTVIDGGGNNLRIEGGSSFATRDVSFGNTFANAVVVTGAGSLLRGASVHAGTTQGGNLSILDGAEARIGRLELALSTLRVEGIGSHLEVGTLAGGDTTTRSVSPTIDIAAGARVNAGSMTILGLPFRSAASLHLDGAGTLLEITDNFESGGAGAVEMRITKGAEARVGNAFLSSGVGLDSIATVSGAGSAWTVGGKLLLGLIELDSPGRTVLTVEQGALLKSDSAEAVATRGELIVKGAGSLWRNASELTLGGHFFASDSLTIDAGGRVETGTLRLGTGGRLDLLNGTLRITGPDGLVLGTRGLDRPFTLDAGQALEVANALDVSQGGQLTLSGGQVSAQIFSLTGGAFTWTGGTLEITADEDFVVGARGLPQAFLVPQGGRLQVARNVVVGSGRWLLLDGGELAARGIDVAGGTVSTTGVLDLDVAGDVRGHGLVAGGISGGAGRQIVAQGGTLTLGDANRADGFRFGGTLDTGSNQVILLSVGRALLGASTKIGPGGQLSAVNGATLAGGSELSFSGAATVFGDFTNNGVVQRAAGADPASALTFRNDVDGAGSFGGAVVFRAAYNPGNSPATIRFHGEDATFDPSSVLTIELLGAAPGSQYDQLVDIGLLTFHGRLHLAFEGGYAPAGGTTFDLLDFAAFAGSLAPDRIDVTGFDRTRLDFSRLATTGELTVAAVPEPETWALFALGAGVLGWRLRRTRGQRRARELRR